ncbi:MAG: DNA-binding protein WhiA [Propionibacteriaceae bacterium]|nr:DNA-binding protein WhiA [Propionibacteriaceae bacterium]
MALTLQVKSELAVLPISKRCCRQAEIATLLRFAGGLHLTGGGNIMVEAELDVGAAARRLRVAIAEVYNLVSEFVIVRGSAPRRGPRYLVRLVQAGPAIARLAGLVDARGHPIRGLPPAVVGGGLCDAAATWRGAFLARGCLTEPGRSMSLEITAPGPEAAMALVGAARRLGVMAKARESRGADRVSVRDGDSIAALLTKMGAHEALLAWEERRVRREVRASAHRLANFDDANLRRSARAAVAAGVRVQRALEILGDEVPGHLRQAGLLRLQHKEASLEELGALHDPPLTKDAIAGRVRRLLALADKRAEELRIPNTEAALSRELREEA